MKIREISLPVISIFQSHSESVRSFSHLPTSYGPINKLGELEGIHCMDPVFNVCVNSGSIFQAAPVTVPAQSVSLVR
jgi:hypothetical protein